jgi:hypothetical protein
MKAAGLVILILGLILVVSGIGMVVGSVFLIKASVESALESRVVKTIALTVDEPASSEPIDVNREKKCQIVVQADLSGTDVKRETHGDDVDYHLDYNIPFECEVFDDAGQSIHRESSTLSGSGFRMTLNSDVDKEGGSETPRIMLGTFDAPPSGKLTVKAKLGKNQGGDIEIKAAQVDVLDNVTASGAQAAGGVGMCCGGPAVSGLGVLLLIIGAIISLASRSRRAPPPSQSVS